MKSSGIVLIVLGVAVIAFVTAAQGCNIDKIIKTDVPVPVQKETGAPASVTLYEFPYVLEEYDRKFQARASEMQAEYESGRKQFVENGEQAMFAKALFTSVVDDAVKLSLPGVANLPGGLILSNLLVGVGGLLVGRLIPPKKALDEAWQEGVDDVQRIKGR